MKYTAEQIQLHATCAYPSNSAIVQVGLKSNLLTGNDVCVRPLGGIRSTLHDKAIGWILSLVVDFAQSNLFVFASAVDLYYRYLSVRPIVDRQHLQFIALCAFGLSVKVHSDQFSSDTANCPRNNAVIGVKFLLRVMPDASPFTASHYIRQEMDILNALSFTLVARNPPFVEIVFAFLEANNPSLVHKHTTKLAVLVAIFGRFDVVVGDVVSAALCVVLVSQLLAENNVTREFYAKLLLQKLLIDFYMCHGINAKFSTAMLLLHLPHCIRTFNEIFSDICAHEDQYELGVLIRQSLPENFLTSCCNRLRALEILANEKITKS